MNTRKAMLELLEQSADLRPARPGYAYSCGQDFVLKHGSWFKPCRKPKNFSWGRPKCCFGNAIILAAQNEFLPYVEGYALLKLKNGFVPIHHAWNDMDGSALDVTWKVSGAAYFGVRFSVEHADDCTWNGDATVLDDWKRQWPLFRKPWQGDGDKIWPPSPRLLLARRLKEKNGDRQATAGT